jgi:hypothetical protein
VGRAIYICFPGFTPDQPVDAVYAFPDGRSEKQRVATYSKVLSGGRGIAAELWYALPSRPTGVYQVTATQGALTGHGSFTVDAAKEQVVIVAPPTSGPPGTTFVVESGGVAAGARAEFNIYVGDAGSMRYVTTLTSVADSRGNATVTIATTAADRGSFCVSAPVPRGREPFCDSFAHLITLRN